MKVVFLGNPSISVSALKSLNENKDIDVIGVITYEDKKIGRSHNTLKETPVAKYSNENNLKLIKTNSINNDVNKIKELGSFDYLITCAFGQFLNDEVLNTPTKLPLNIHASLLPKGRGGAPIHWSIINNEKETGVSFMKMVSKMDAGPYYAQDKISIDADETYDSLYEKISKLIFEVTAKRIIEIDNGAPEIEQDESKVSFWLNIKKDDSKLDFSQSAEMIDSKIRGLNSKPKSWTKINNTLIRVSESKVLNEPIPMVMKVFEIGEIISIDEKGILINTGNGYLYLTRITIEGKKSSYVKDIINGSLPFKVGDVFEM